MTVAEREQLILANLDCAEILCKKYRRPGCADWEDVLQAAYLGLCCAAERYDPEQGTAFRTYAGFWVKKYIFEHIAAQTQTVEHEAREADLWVPDETSAEYSALAWHAAPAQSAEAEAEAAENAIDFDQFGARLTPTEKAALALKYGAGRNNRPHTTTEIGRLLGISTETARTTCKRAEEKIRASVEGVRA